MRKAACGILVALAALIAGGASAQQDTSAGPQSLYNWAGNWTAQQKFKVGSGAPLIIFRGLVAPTLFPSTAGLIVDGADGVQSAIGVLAYGTAPNFLGQRASGTQLSPTAVLANTDLIRYAGLGYGTTGYSTPAASPQFALQTSEDWTDTAHGSRMVWRIVANGTVVQTNAMALQNDGVLTLGTITPSGAAKLQVTGGSLLDTATIGTSTGPTLTAGAGVPSSTQPNGSVYLRTDGGANTRLYVSQGGGVWGALTSP